MLSTNYNLVAVELMHFISSQSISRSTTRPGQRTGMRTTLLNKTIMLMSTFAHYSHLLLLFHPSLFVPGSLWIKRLLGAKSSQLIQSQTGTSTSFLVNNVVNSQLSNFIMVNGLPWHLATKERANGFKHHWGRLKLWATWPKNRRRGHVQSASILTVQGLI